MKGNEMELAGRNGVALADTEAVKSRLVMVRGQAVLLDGDVAELYGVETRRVNEAVRNNPDKFPEGYVLVLDEEESKAVRSQNATSGKGAGRGHYSKFNFKAFTERGLYMLATILKGERAAKTTLAIIETYAQVRELARTMEALQGSRMAGSDSGRFCIGRGRFSPAWSGTTSGRRPRRRKSSSISRLSKSATRSSGARMPGEGKHDGRLEQERDGSGRRSAHGAGRLWCANDATMQRANGHTKGGGMNRPVAYLETSFVSSSNEILDEVYAAREKLWQRGGGTMRGVCEYLRECGRRAKERGGLWIESAEEREAIGAEVRARLAREATEGEWKDATAVGEERERYGVAGGAATGGTPMGGQRGDGPTIQRFYDATMQRSNDPNP